MKKFTAATAKSFINKNRADLWIKVSSDFDGMTDCVQYDRGAVFAPVRATENVCANNLGISGVWLVGSSRDYFTPIYVSDVLIGFKCSNCCGSWEVRVKMQGMTSV